MSARRGMTYTEEQAKWAIWDQFDNALKKQDHVRAIEIGCNQLGYHPIAVQDILWLRDWRGSIERPEHGLFDLIGQALVSLPLVNLL